MEIEKNDVLNWFWKFRPDLTVDEDFVEGLHQEFLQANNKLSLDEITFYGFVVTNYKSEIIDFIYPYTLEQELFRQLLQDLQQDFLVLAVERLSYHCYLLFLPK